jgi:hypothetical protein
MAASAFVAKKAVAGDDRTEKRTGLDERQLSYWDQGKARLFVSGRLEGGLYAKPQVAVGYGQPHWFNATAEAYAISTMSFGAGYAGLRGTLPFLDLRVGTRYTFSYYRSLLPVKAHYVAEDVSTPNGPLARYRSLETELTGIVPILDGFLFPVITVYRIVDIPAGNYLFDESLRGVLEPPWIMGFRLGYVKNFGHDGFFKVGVLSELIVLPGRSDDIVRIGPAADVQITDHLDAQGTVTFVVSSPDSLGIWNGPFGVLGLVYRWASGDPHPAFP